MFSFGQIYPLKKGVWVKLKSFFYYKYKIYIYIYIYSEFTWGFKCKMAVATLMV